MDSNYNSSINNNCISFKENNKAIIKFKEVIVVITRIITIAIAVINNQYFKRTTIKAMTKRIKVMRKIIKFPNYFYFPYHLAIDLKN